jgi:hypothetical protein
MAKTNKKSTGGDGAQASRRGKKDGRGVADWWSAAKLKGFGETLREIGRGLEEAAAWMNEREIPKLLVENQAMFRESVDRVGTFLENVTRARRAAATDEAPASVGGARNTPEA